MLIAVFLMGVAAGVLMAALYALWPDVVAQWNDTTPARSLSPSPEYEAAMARVQAHTRPGFTLGPQRSAVPDYGPHRAGAA